ncbi:hypothetical protein Bca4012_073425 [Brassica carinata]
MVNSSIILADLKAGSCSNTVKVRLIRFGEARIVKNGGHLRGVHMLLLNEKVGCMVLMSLEARFTTKYNQLMALANTNFDLADIMGEVSCINTVFDNENHFIHHNNPIRQERRISFSLQIKTGLEPATIASLCLLIKQTQDDFNAWLDISTLNQIRKIATLEMQMNVNRWKL